MFFHTAGAVRCVTVRVWDELFNDNNKFCKLFTKFHNILFYIITVLLRASGVNEPLAYGRFCVRNLAMTVPVLVLSSRRHGR